MLLANGSLKNDLPLAMKNLMSHRKPKRNRDKKKELKTKSNKTDEYKK